MFEWMGVGVPERDAPRRALASVVVLATALVSILGFVWMWQNLPFWFAFPAGLMLIALGFVLALSVVGRIVGKKVKAPYNRFGDE